MFNKNNVEKLMCEKGLTKYRLAKEARLGQSTVHEILSGKKKTPSATTLQKLATALDTTVDAFFDNNTPENNSEINTPEEYSYKYKITSRDKKQYLEEIKKANEAFFLDDEFNEEAKKEMLDLMSELFWEAKAMNKRKK